LTTLLYLQVSVPSAAAAYASRSRLLGDDFDTIY